MKIISIKIVFNKMLKFVLQNMLTILMNLSCYKI